MPQALDFTRAAWRTFGGSDFWAYCLVAEGVADATAEWGIQPYDIAACIPIVQEAGGIFTTVDGDSGPWLGSALATNGALHPEASRVLAAR
jgi:histidinol-phosphatase